MSSSDEPARIGDALVARVDLARGAKITSLRDHLGHEWLLPPRTGTAPPPGTAFVDAEMGGWDECAPTIDASHDPRGRPVPDHGDLWDVAWTGSAARHTARGRSLPYEFTRALSATADGLCLDYTVVAQEDLPFLWAAHPQFRAPPGTRVLLDGVSSVVDVLGATPAARSWPVEGETIDGVAAGGRRKVYVDPLQTVSRATLVVPGRPLRLTLSWDAAVVAYLGVWFDGGAYAREPVIAVEPTTGWFDSLAGAVGNDRVLRLPADRPVSWQVRLTVG